MSDRRVQTIIDADRCQVRVSSSSQRGRHITVRIDGMLIFDSSPAAVVTVQRFLARSEVRRALVEEFDRGPR